MTTWTEDRPEPNQELCERGYLIDWVEHLGCWEYKRMGQTKWLTEDEALVKDGLVSRKYEFGDRVEILGSDEEGIVMGVDRNGLVVVRSEAADNVAPFYPESLAYIGPSMSPEPAWKASLRRMAEGERRCKEQGAQQEEVDEHGLIGKEQVVNEHIGAAWKAYSELPIQHPSEPEDFADAIHTLQQLLALRVVRRDYPEGWPTYDPREGS